MPTFSKLRRNLFDKNYLIFDILGSFLLALLNSQFIYFPLLIGIVISLNFRLSFVVPFLFFVSITHNFGYFSLIVFFVIYKLYIFPILSAKFHKSVVNYISVFLIYVLYFSMLSSIYTMFDIPLTINSLYIIYYIMIEEILLLIRSALWQD